MALELIGEVGICHGTSEPGFTSREAGLSIIFGPLAVARPAYPAMPTPISDPTT
ncbi:hypothetical protein FHX44_113213 [Pseudonocardia hierapolitana]|uniref:Uncharacterized protein n=1 Tax=Pseudonocardia hierapolitana TaxID=1128676 RepID=A0A561SR27_9PSEU|nr:hypothetical protein FHX44_113213 [Pseudonocardia hierapolitana]